MKTARTIAFVALLGMSLTACGRDDKSAAEPVTKEEKTEVSSTIHKAIAEARDDLRTKNITVSHEDNLPKAEITPEGDLLIDGKKIPANPQQHALLLQYRADVLAIAEAGMEIGAQGAGLATKAVGEAFKGIFSGKSEQDIEKAVEAEAGKMKAAAAQLCGRLPAMMQTQQKLAAAMPEFKPYANMTQKDIDDCLDDTERDTASIGQDVAGAAKDAANAANDARDAAKEAADAAKEAADAAQEAADAAEAAAKSN